MLSHFIEVIKIGLAYSFRRVKEGGIYFVGEVKEGWRIAQAEKLRLRNEIVTAKREEISNYRWFLNSDALSNIDSFFSNNEKDIKILENYFLSTKYSSLVSFSKSLAEKISIDRASRSGPYTFKVSSGVLLEGFDDDALRRILKGIAKGYKVSHNNNTLLSAALVSQKSYGFAAVSAEQGARNSYQAGAHNESVDTAFLYGIRHITFSISSADISDVHRKYIVMAKRMIDLDYTTARLRTNAYFSLIFNEGHSKIDLGGIEMQFRDAVWSEFMGNFGNLIKSPREAAEFIDVAIDSGNADSKLRELPDLGYLFKNRYDLKRFLP